MLYLLFVLLTHDVRGPNHMVSLLETLALGYLTRLYPDCESKLLDL